MRDPRVTAFIKLATEEPWKLLVEREKADIDAQVEFANNDFVTDCGWFSNDLGPCGGCDRCIAAQISHYTQRDREETARYARAGFAHVRGLVNVDAGFGFMHDCWAAGECEAGAMSWL